ncbi:ATP-dependent RNA helicase DDX51 [Oryzias melastigma]|uniref:ATP-dependent RNA helicase n=1 Tax=Oryzias melastigma TaxID=30732 RepID=A0A3B3CXQ3_ORYME|nr:ATP-dependent RNA helicase DDX51 [Oryzias melastigma]KAF6729888.1 ATP-dependent RNA helicase DDX51 [Oryzias melastigma]
MSLFVINRYLGDEDDCPASKSQSEALLQKLQQKAEWKQRQTLKERAQHEQTEQKRPPKRKQEEHQPCKKRKSEDVPLSEDDSENHTEAVELRKKDAGGKRTKREEVSEDPADDAPAPEDEPAEPEESSPHTGFTVLGDFENKPSSKVHRVLPQWLSQPDVIRRDIKNNLLPVGDESPLCPQLQKKLQDNGVHHFFPVQAEVIPAILQAAQNGALLGRGGFRPRDICVSAPTGSGKTLAFVLPVIQVLMTRMVCEVRALAVLPTKELAQQVYKVFVSYAEGTPLRVLMLAGQKSFAAEQASLSEIRGGVRRSTADIIVATPGRLVDHINKNSGLNLQQLRFLIIDEADRMIDSMHQSWLSLVMKAVYGAGSETNKLLERTEPACITAASLSPPQMPLQKLLFSATLTQNPEKLQQLGLHQPRLFSSAHSSESPADAAALKPERFDFPQGLTEYYVPCTLSKKPLLILHFILRMKLHPILCFTNSRESAHRLYLLVQLFGGVQAAEFSSRLSPKERKRTLKEFEQGKIQLLISTDAAARGIDIPGVKCVVNYDAPQYIRMYIHRVGRTARAGKSGLAFTFLLGVQEKKFLQMVVEAGSPGLQKQIVKPESLKSMEERYEETLQELAAVVKNEKTR